MHDLKFGKGDRVEIVSDRLDRTGKNAERDRPDQIGEVEQLSTTHSGEPLIWVRWSESDVQIYQSHELRIVSRYGAD